MPDDAQQLPTLSDEDQAALQRWIREKGIGEKVTDVEPLTGGTQNIVVRVLVDGRPMVLRRPPVHPRPTSDKTMLREIAALRTLAGSPVPHPGFIAGCDDLDVLGVVFYLMEEVDGFNPGDTMDQAYVRNADWRHTVGLSYAASLAKLGNVAWEGSRDRFWSARFRNFCGCSRAIGTTATSRSRWPSRIWRSGWHPTDRPMASPASCTATRI
jgi:aminoglycoside phosphotransferase (APT) family kinase protein